jgi:CrcB protein
VCALPWREIVRALGHVWPCATQRVGVVFGCQWDNKTDACPPWRGKYSFTHVFKKSVVLNRLGTETAHASSRMYPTMADINNDDEDALSLSRRTSHFNQQRSSLRSETSHILSRSRPQSGQRLDNFDLDIDCKSRDRADSETLPSPSSPAPNVPYTRSRASSNVRGKSSRRAYSRSGPDDVKRLESLLAPDNLDDLLSSSQPQIPLQPLHIPAREDASSRASKTQLQRSRHSSFLFGPLGSQLDITALPSITTPTTKMNPYIQSKNTRAAQRRSRIVTELYTVSYLIFFAIWGTLARLGLQALTFYYGAPVVFSELWANVAGTFIMGFLSEDRRLFHAEWGNEDEPEPMDRPAEERKKRHGKVKKTIPMYIGLATGFCGCFTSFSSFMRDVFFALSNDLKAPIYHPGALGTALLGRDQGYSVLAVLATVIVTLSTCYAALKLGSHFALLLDPVTPTFPFRFTRHIIDPAFVVLGWGCWFAAILLSIFPPHDAWRSQALFACVFAPIGCLARYYLSVFLNPLRPSFPLGTFTANIFGTAVLGMAYDLQHVPLHFSGVVGGSIPGCQVLQGIEDGFCGALTTVSTWISEIDGAEKRRGAYVFGGACVGVGIAVLVAVMGSVRWGVGWQASICAT